MQWIKPDYQEISLGMEVTAYVNTDEDRPVKEETARKEHAPSTLESERETQA
jgi:coenzyme PQQ precursor peptide PqqA